MLRASLAVSSRDSSRFRGVGWGVGLCSLRSCDAGSGGFVCVVSAVRSGFLLFTQPRLAPPMHPEPYIDPELDLRKTPVSSPCRPA